MNVTERKYALDLDVKDPLAKFRSEYVINDPEICYLDGNSLGRLPKRTITAINDYLLNDWGTKVVEGWGEWIEEPFITGDLLGRTTLGAAAGQVLVTDTTSVNFYQLAGAALAARPGRKTIIIDAANFPTDRYILQGYAKTHGLNLITINNEDPAISQHERITPELLEKYMSDDVAFVSFEVIQYRAGARNDIKAITDLARKYGAFAIWDCSHAIGAIDMQFDRDGVDLAVGCTYKFGSAGPGAPGWLYVSKRVQNDLQVPIQGWHAQKNQFDMGPNFERASGLAGFQIATPSIIALRSVQTSFGIIEEAGIANIEEKCAIGTQMMIELYDAWLADLGFTLNTPRDAKLRGGHVSLVHPEGKRIAFALRQISNVIPDYRAPNSVRLAISPLQNSYVEIWDGFERLRDLVATKQYEKISNLNSKVT
jgi:kynureninase